MRAGRWPAGRPDGLLTLFLDGCRRVARAPGVLVAVWAFSLLGLPGFYYLRQVYGLGQLALGAEIIGVDDGWSRLLVAVWVSVLLLVWTFLWGGILDRYARPAGTPGKTFTLACRTYAGRMLRVGLIGSVVYALVQSAESTLLNWIGNSWPFNRPHAEWADRMLIALLIQLCMLPAYAVHVLTDLTRVRLVLEDRRSVTFAIAAGWRLLKARPLAVLGIYLLTALAFAALSRAWLLLAAEAPQAEGWAPPLAAWLYWMVRVWAEMLIPATLVALYQSEMARGTLATRQNESAPAFVPDMNTSLAKESLAKE